MKWLVFVWVLCVFSAACTHKKEHVVIEPDDCTIIKAGPTGAMTTVIMGEPDTMEAKHWPNHFHIISAECGTSRERKSGIHFWHNQMHWSPLVVRYRSLDFSPGPFGTCKIEGKVMDVVRLFRKGNDSIVWVHDSRDMDSTDMLISHLSYEGPDYSFLIDMGTYELRYHLTAK